MSILGDLAVKATGQWIKSLAVPVLLLGSVTAAHQMIKARAEAKAAQEAALVDRGRSQCLAEVQLAQVRADLNAERQKVETARGEAAAAQAVARVVGDNVRDLEERLRAAEANGPGSNPGCLSDGMRDRLWGATGGAGGQGQRRGGGGSSTDSGGRTP